MLEREDLDCALEQECECETEHAEQQDESDFSPREHQNGFWS